MGRASKNVSGKNVSRLSGRMFERNKSEFFHVEERLLSPQTSILSESNLLDFDKALPSNRPLFHSDSQFSSILIVDMMWS